MEQPQLPAPEGDPEGTAAFGNGANPRQPGSWETTGIFGEAFPSVPAEVTPGQRLRALNTQGCSGSAELSPLLFSPLLLLFPDPTGFFPRVWSLTHHWKRSQSSSSTEQLSSLVFSAFPASHEPQLPQPSKFHPMKMSMENGKSLEIEQKKLQICLLGRNHLSSRRGLEQSGHRAEALPWKRNYLVYKGILIQNT